MFENQPRSLTLPEMRTVTAHEDQNEKDIALLVLAYGEAKPAVREWFNAAPVAHAVKVLQAAWDASNATEDAQFPGEAPNDAVAGWRDE